VGSTLPSPLMMTVTDTDGHGVAGINVHWDFGTVPSGASGQSLSTRDIATDANGQASTRLTLGNVAGTYNVTAQASGLPDQTRTFTETATASSTNMVMSSGSGQSASAGVTLASP